MAEEATTTTSRRGPGRPKADLESDVKLDSIGPDTSGMGEVLQVREVQPSAEVQSPAAGLDSLLMGFILFRRAQIYVPRLGGNIGGAAAVEAAKAEAVLREFENFVNWLRDGTPNPQQRISESEKDFYRAAIARGLTVPEEIKRQL